MLKIKTKTPWLYGIHQHGDSLSEYPYLAVEPRKLRRYSYGNSWGMSPGYQSMPSMYRTGISTYMKWVCCVVRCFSSGKVNIPTPYRQSDYIFAKVCKPLGIPTRRTQLSPVWPVLWPCGDQTDHRNQDQTGQDASTIQTYLPATGWWCWILWLSYVISKRASGV